MSTCFDEYLPFLLSALIDHSINAAEGDFNGEIFKLRWCRAWWIKPARLARTPIEISFVVGIYGCCVNVFSQICQSIGFDYIITWWGVLF